MFSFKVSALILSLCFVSFLTFVVTSTVHAQSDQQIVKYKNLTLDLGLAQLNHPDHSIITYPNLGHEFYPSSQWFTQNPSQNMSWQTFLHGLDPDQGLQISKVVL